MEPRTFIPCDQLKPFVRIFTIVETADEQIYKVLPDTELVIGFQFKGRLFHISNETEIALSPSGITGLRDQFRLFKNSSGIGTVLVFFKEAGAVPFFREPLQELFGESVSLDQFMLRSELLILEEQLCEAASDEKRIAAIEQFLLSRMQPVQPDQLVLAALSLIHQSKGMLRIGDLAKQLHTSASPLEKRFRQAVGTSPKKFAAIVRMKNAIGNYDPENSLTELGYASGFYDQAHFIREFKAFTGEAPRDFFAPADEKEAN